jgi:hypothetical protein
MKVEFRFHDFLICSSGGFHVGHRGQDDLCGRLCIVIERLVKDISEKTCVHKRIICLYNIFVFFFLLSFLSCNIRVYWFDVNIEALLILHHNV